MSDYREIDGKRYDADLLATAEKLISGRGDGRLSRTDAEAILAKITDANVYTEVERDTIAYIRDHFEWSEAAADWFGTEVGKWSASHTRH